MALLAARIACAGVSVIDPTSAGSDLGAAVNRALAQAPSELMPDAQIEVIEGSLIEPLKSNATVRAMPKAVASLRAGEYGVIVTGVAADGREVAAGEPLRVTVANGPCIV